MMSLRGVLQSSLINHILKCCIRSLGQEDVVVQELWSDLSEQGNQQSLDSCFSQICILNQIMFL